VSTFRVLLVCFMLVTVVGISVGATDNSYSISPQQSVDIDSRTVEFESETYTVSEIGYASVNGDLSVTTSGPEEGTYNLYFYNSERNIVDTESRLSGTETTTFDLQNVDAGSYTLVINADGERKAVQPVVANGYDITIDAPDSATVGENGTVSLSVSKKAGVEESIRSVKLHVRVDGESRQVTATKTADGTYEATLDIDQAGTFSVYAGIQGHDKINDEYEVIAISESQTFKAAEQTATETASDGGGDQNDGTDSSDGDQSTTSTQTTTSTATQTKTQIQTQTVTQTESQTQTTTETTTGTATETDTATPDAETETADNVVTPAGDSTGTTTTTASTGLAVSLSVLLALLVVWAGSKRE